MGYAVCTLHHYFNPRSREGSDSDRLFTPPLLQYFNPRSREGSDLVYHANFRKCCISIHAPAKGATTTSRHLGNDVKISIHAPAKGATEIRASCAKFSTFQSTLPRRERRSSDRRLHRSMSISIHAPAKGATLCRALLFSKFDISIHSPAKGATRD